MPVSKAMVICPLIFPAAISVSSESKEEKGKSALAELPMMMVFCACRAPKGSNMPHIRVRNVFLK